jgi:hypothetical protein
VEESSKKKTGALLERMRKGTFPPAAVAAAFASFAEAALATGRRRPDERSTAVLQKQGNLPKSEASRAGSDIEYLKVLSVRPRFRRSLTGIAIGSSDKIFALGDAEVRVFGPDGTELRSWRAPEGATCIAVAGDDRVYLGVAGRVQVFSGAGVHSKDFEAGAAGQRAEITSIKVLPKEILVADAAVRYIHRFDTAGKRIGAIGDRTQTRGFMLPNRFLDIDVDSRGTVIATDSGRHRVSLWTLDGAPVRNFGKFGMWNPEDFVGCCNPVNLAFAPGGGIVTAEKVVPRVKVYDAEGKLLSVIRPEHFDPKCSHLHLAADSKGRILVADPVRLEVKVFSVVEKPGGRESV